MDSNKLTIISNVEGHLIGADGTKTNHSHHYPPANNTKDAVIDLIAGTAGDLCFFVFFNFS